VTDWNSTLYLKFERERTRAARDLLAQLPEFEPRNVFDLGCGPGNSTELLATAFPRATIVGIDFSDDMLAVAKSRLGSAKFIKQDIENWRPTGSVDLIFANAALQFVPNHHELMTRLVSFLSDGGWLAVQMPNNIHESSHALMRMVAADGPWANRLMLIAKTRALIGTLDDYYRLLTSLCSSVDIWQTTYLHPLDGADGIVEWFEGSGLRPFLEPLNFWEREMFLSRYRSELGAAYPTQPNGKVLLRYPRLFFVAQR
jgi:trans-aconitate 2-methyltransferase